MNKHQEFKLLNENFNKWLKEDNELDSFLQERINNKFARLNESEINIGGAEGVTLRSDFLKWTSITGISTLAITQAAMTAALFAGWEATLIMVGASLIPAISTMLPFLAVGGIAAYIKVPMFRKLINWIFKKIGSKTLDSMKEAVTLTIDKMIEASGGELTKEKAGELYALIATEIVKNSEFRKKMLDMLKAMKNKESEKIALLSSELDDLVEKIIKTEILTSPKGSTGEQL